MNRGSLDLIRELKQRVREGSDLNLRVQKSGCLDFCEQGPTCVVYPEGTWYSLNDEAALEAVYQHLVSGTIDEQATLKLQ
jgi:(2Fe-2S) ferredoxin